MAIKGEVAAAKEGWWAATAEVEAARKQMEAQTELRARENNQLVRQRECPA